MNLYPFQIEGVNRIQEFKGRCLLADEMGLGKTAQSIAWAKWQKKERIIVVCPASLKYNWLNEFNKWADNYANIVILSGRKSKQIKKDTQVVIINYDILSYWCDVLKQYKPEVVILDESHYIKNNKAKRTKACQYLCVGVPHIIAITGTPIESKPCDIFATMKILNRNLFSNQKYFYMRYCDLKITKWGWDYTGASNQEELHNKLTNNVMIRRMKKDVLPDLPDKTIITNTIELTNKREYTKAETEFISWIRETKGSTKANQLKGVEALAKIEYLKQLTAQGKMKYAIEWIKDYLENENKLVIFYTHKEVGKQLSEEFKNISVKIDGDTPNEKRQQYVEKFQSNPNTHLFLGNIKAAGTGLTLTAANAVCFLELAWNPTDMDQATDRIHRVGQTADKVFAYYLLGLNTIEDSIMSILDTKRKNIDKIIDGKDTSDDNLLSEIIKQYS